MILKINFADKIAKSNKNHKEMSNKPISCAFFIQEDARQATLKEAIGNYNSLYITSFFKSSFETIEKLNKARPQVLFIDISMADLLRHITKPPHIIGVCDQPSNRKVKELLSCGFTDFIYLPIAEKNLNNVIGKILNTNSFFQELNDMTQIMEDDMMYIDATNNTLETNITCFFVQDKRYGKCKVNFSEFVYAQSIGNDIRIVKDDGSTYYERNTLKNFQRKLGYSKCLKINRSILINTDKVNRINKKTVTLNNETFTITRTYYKKFAKVFNI